MKSYNQFMCEVYDLQESGQIDLVENPFKGMFTRFSQSPVGKTLNKVATKAQPLLNNPITRNVARASVPLTAAGEFVDRRINRGQGMTRSAGTAIAQTAVGLKGATLGGAKGAAACAVGGPIAAGVCGTAGAIAGGLAGYHGTGAAIDATVDAAKRKTPRSAAGSLGTTGDALGARLPRINK